MSIFGINKRADVRGRIKGRIKEHLRMPLYRNGYTLLAAAVTTSALGVIFWAAAVRFYSPEVVGLSSAVISAMTLLAGVASLSLQGVLVRFLPAAGPHARRLILFSYAASAGAALLLGWLFTGVVASWAPNLGAIGADIKVAGLFVFATISWCIFNLQDGALTGLRQALWVPIENTAYASSKIVLMALFAAAMPRWGIFVAWVLPAVVALPPINWLIFRRILPKRTKVAAVETVTRESISRYVAGNYPGTLFNLAFTTMLPIIVTHQVGTQANAYFYMPWMIYTSLQLVSINLATSLTVEAVHDHHKLALYYYQVWLQCMRLLVPLVLVLFLGAPWLLQIFGPVYAAEGTMLLRLLALAALPNTLVVLYVSLRRVQNQIWGLVVVQGLLAVLLLGLSYWLLPQWGITGVGVATLVSQICVAAVVLTQLARVLRAGRAEHTSDKQAHRQTTAVARSGEGIL